MSVPITPGRVFECFSRDELECLHRATLHLIERAGMEFGSLEAKCILAKIGCLGAYACAWEKARRILETHRPEPLSPSALGAMRGFWKKPRSRCGLLKGPRVEIGVKSSLVMDNNRTKGGET